MNPKLKPFRRFPRRPRGTQSDAFGDMQFDRMTEEDLLRGLEGLVPPADTEDDGD